MVESSLVKFENSLCYPSLTTWKLVCQFVRYLLLTVVCVVFKGTHWCLFCSRFPLFDSEKCLVELRTSLVDIGTFLLKKCELNQVKKICWVWRQKFFRIVLVCLQTKAVHFESNIAQSILFCAAPFCQLPLPGSSPPSKSLIYGSRQDDTPWKPVSRLI